MMNVRGPSGSRRRTRGVAGGGREAGGGTNGAGDAGVVAGLAAGEETDWSKILSAIRPTTFCHISSIGLKHRLGHRPRGLAATLPAHAGLRAGAGDASCQATGHAGRYGNRARPSPAQQKQSGNVDHA